MLASFRFGPDDSWPGGKTIANHSKLWMVDDRKAADILLDSCSKPLWQ